MSLRTLTFISALVIGSAHTAVAQQTETTTPPTAEPPASQQAAPISQAQSEAADEEEDEAATEIGPAPKIIGGASLGYRSVNVDRDSYKFEEYRDMSSGVVLGSELMYFRDNDYFGYFRADDLLQKDRSAEYRGGQYNGLQYSLYGNTLRHTYSLGARTFYTSGVDSDQLTYSAADYGTTDGDPNNFTISTDVSQWRKLDYRKTIDSIGGSLTFRSEESPWSARLTADYRRIEGLYPLGVASGLHPDFPAAPAPGRFGHAIEVPAPLGGTNLMAGAEVSHNTENFIVTLSGDVSRYDNKYDYVTFRDPFVTTINQNQTASLDPDSNSFRLGLKAVVKELPFLRSHLVLSYARTMITSEIGLRDTIANSTASGTYGDVTLGLSSPTFHGKINYDKAAAIWSADPTDNLTTEIAARYTHKENKSDEITYTNGGAEVSNGLFEYEKNDVSAGLGYKLPADSKADLSVTRTGTIRHERHDAPNTQDMKYHLGLKNSSSEYVTAGVEFEYLERNSDFGLSNAGTGNTDAALLLRYFRPYDAANKRRSGVRVNTDITPIENVSIGLSYGFSRDNYTDNLLGLKEDSRDEAYADVSWEKPEMVKISLFYDIERSRNNGAWRQALSSQGGYDTDPVNGANGANSFNWTGAFNDQNTYYGAMIDIPILKNRLDLSLGYTQMDNDGRADFEAANGTNPQDIEAFGDFKKQEYSAKATYKINPNFSTTLAYAQQKLTVDDKQWSAYTPIVSANNDRALGNAMSDNSFDAKIVYASLNCSF